jgi:hypothetical protein
MSLTFGEKLSKWKEGERKDVKRHSKGSMLSIVRSCYVLMPHTRARLT